MADFLLYYKEPCPNDRKIGDIIHVLPDGSSWGNLECIEDFLVVNVPSLSIEEAREYAKPLTMEVDEQSEVIAKSRYYINLNDALEYDDLAEVYTKDWIVPKVDVSKIKDKSNN